MLEISNKIEGDFVVEQDINLSGMVTGSVTVKAPNCLVMCGLVCQDLVAEQGSVVEIQGKVIGAVINNGADLEITGVIGSLQENHNALRARIVQGAVVQTG